MSKTVKTKKVMDGLYVATEFLPRPASYFARSERYKGKRQMNKETLRDLIDGGLHAFETLTELDLLGWIARGNQVQKQEDADENTKTLAAFAVFGALSVLAFRQEQRDRNV